MFANELRPNVAMRMSTAGITPQERFSADSLGRR